MGAAHRATSDAASHEGRSVGRGRPRTEGLGERVLAATRAEVEAHGYVAATVDRIAAAAGVSKGSIYRRWPSKGVLAYDACVADVDPLRAVIDTGDIRADLLAVARITAEAYRGGSGVAAQVMAEAARDPQLAALLRDRFFAPRSDAISARVVRAVERGELRPGLDPELVPAVLNGTQPYVWAVRQRALTDDELLGLVDMLVGPHLP